MLDVVAADDAEASGRLVEDDFGADAIALHAEGDAAFDGQARGLGPAFGFIGENLGERAEASVALQFGETFGRDFVAQDFSKPAGLLGGGFFSSRRWEVKERKRFGRIGGEQRALDICKHRDGTPAGCATFVANNLEGNSHNERKDRGAAPPQ